MKCLDKLVTVKMDKINSLLDNITPFAGANIIDDYMRQLEINHKL